MNEMVRIGDVSQNRLCGGNECTMLAIMVKWGMIPRALLLCGFILWGSGVTQMAYADNGFNPLSETRESFRFDSFNKYLLAPRPKLQPTEITAEMLGSVLRHLFPAGTAVEELDAFIGEQARRPEVKKTDKHLHPHQRVSKNVSDNKVVFFYRFTIPIGEIYEVISNSSGNDLELARYMMMKMAMFTWILVVNISEDEVIQSISVRLETLAP